MDSWINTDINKYKCKLKLKSVNLCHILWMNTLKYLYVFNMYILLYWCTWWHINFIHLFLISVVLDLQTGRPNTFLVVCHFIPFRCFQANQFFLKPQIKTESKADKKKLSEGLRESAHGKTKPIYLGRERTSVKCDIIYCRGCHLLPLWALLSSSVSDTLTRTHAAWSQHACVCLCARWIASDHLAAQGGWFNLRPAGALWLVNPWRAPSSGDVKGQVGTQMMWQPTKTSVSHHKHTKKDFCVHGGSHPDREHEILMTDITFYTHTNNKNGLCWRDYGGVSRGEMGWEECE